MVRAYGPCPIHETSVFEGDEPHKPRAAVSEVYAQIIKDLKMAETLMFSMKSQEHKPGRPASGAASLLLAKVYLNYGIGGCSAGTEVTVLGGPAFKG